MRAAEAESEDGEDVTVECQCDASLYRDTSAQSRVSYAAAQLRLASSTISLHVCDRNFRAIRNKAETVSLDKQIRV